MIKKIILTIVVLAILSLLAWGGFLLWLGINFGGITGGGPR